jgi:trehalose 6-phosphate synthase
MGYIDGVDQAEADSGDDARVPLVVVSHRGPVRFERDGAGARRMERSGGGLVTALLATLPALDRTRFDPVWLCAAATDEDRVVAAEHGSEAIPVADMPCPVRMLAIDPDEHDRFYASFSNPMLWFIQHELWGLATEPVIGRAEHDAYRHGYVPVNHRFADAVHEETERRGSRSPVVMVHDYHFYLVPGLVRSMYPDARLHTFVHVPWPQADAWRVLPAEVRGALLHGLLGNDVIGFHTHRYARNFLLSCQELLDIPVDLGQMVVPIGEREVTATWSPLSVDLTRLQTQAGESPVMERRREIAEVRRDHLVVRVDRSDPSKNIVRGFLAYDLLLECHPELQGRVTFLALIPPSRQDVAQYARYLLEIRDTADAVNERHGRDGWQPIDLRIEENMPLALAAFQEYDALMVNSVADGLNLVAKEGVALNERDGLLVLSENAGAYDELGAFSLGVNPFDIVQQADALHEALTTDAGRRHDLHVTARQMVEHNDPARWLQQQLDALERHTEARASR